MKYFALATLATLIITNTAQAEGVIGNQVSLGAGLPSYDSDQDSAYELDISADYFINSETYLFGGLGFGTFSYEYELFGTVTTSDTSLFSFIVGGGLEKPLQFPPSAPTFFVNANRWSYFVEAGIFATLINSTTEAKNPDFPEFDTKIESDDTLFGLSLGGGVRADYDPILAEIGLQFAASNEEGASSGMSLVSQAGYKVLPAVMVSLESGFGVTADYGYFGARVTYLF